MTGYRPRWLPRLLHLWFLLSRPLTLGVRVAAFTADGRVVLVRHTYVAGWHLPGGGVEPGEDAETAARRELREEAGLEADALHLRGILHNRGGTRRDHVLVYETRPVSEPAAHPGDREIAAAGAFPVDALPDGTTAATRARLAEIAAGHAPPPIW